MTDWQQRLRGVLTSRSLRGRYLGVAGFVVLLVLVSAWLVQAYVSDTNLQSTRNISERNRVIEQSRIIRDALWQAESSIKAYALSPDEATFESLRSNLRAAISASEILGELPWVVDNDRAQQIDQIHRTLLNLNVLSAELKVLRDDTTQLFPYLTMMTEVMAPSNNAFDQAATLAMEEMAMEDAAAYGSRPYRLFAEVRYSWSRMVSVFRIFLANLGGTFGNAQQGMEEQAGNVELYFEKITKLLTQLEAQQATTPFGLQATTSLNDMREMAHRWYVGYKDARHMSIQDWRADVVMIREEVRPAFDEVWQRLVQLDIQLEADAADDQGELARVGDHISLALWLLSMLAVGILIAGYLYFDRTVLRPIAVVTRALKAESIGRDGIEMPKAHTDETRDLVDAFVEMRRQVHSRQMALEYQAMHDALTGLPNRNLMQDRLQQAVYAAQRDGRPLALVMMDLNRFKEINDTLGHQCGDLVLQQVGVRLSEVLRESDTVARLGGDEFALLLPRTHRHQAIQVAQKVVQALEEVFFVDGQQLYIGASLGIALYPEHGDSSQSLIQRADVAMYVAKRSNSGFAIYDASQDQHSISRLALVSDLRQALDGNQLELYYQPQVNVRTGATVCIEALLRWQHPKHGEMLPDMVIPIAEQTGIIKPLTQWVLGKAIEQCAHWRRRGIDLSVAVNLSVWNLQDPELDRYIESLLVRWEVPPGHLILEITESAMMADPDLDILMRLHRMGLRLSVDDYGTGFSSLAYLKTLPISELKIDKSFVMDMTHDDNDAVIVRSTIDLAHNLGRKVVAEGVESKDIYDILEILRCDTVQGYFLSPPLNERELENFLLRSRWAAARPALRLA